MVFEKCVLSCKAKKMSVVIRSFEVFLWTLCFVSPMIEMTQGKDSFLHDAASLDVVDSELHNTNQEGNETYWESSLNGTDPNGPFSGTDDEALPQPSKRQKRIVFGQHFLNPKFSYLTYPVIRWFVAISNSHQCTLYMFKQFFDKYEKANVDMATEQATSNCLLPADNPRCGGAMIAPYIVQTACHCLATFWNFDETEGHIRAQVKGVWEDNNLIFRPGVREDIETVPGEEWWANHKDYYSKIVTLGAIAQEQFLYAKKYFIHQDCQSIGNRVFSNDYGLIFLSHTTLIIPAYVDPYNGVSVPPPRFIVREHHLAPIVAENQMELSWAQAQRRRATCLFVGVGWEDWWAGIFEDLPVPGLIRHTWRSLTGYNWCASFFKEILEIDPFNRTFWTELHQCPDLYKGCCTWGCTLSSGRILGVPSPGDDGGPVICDGMYLGTIGTAWSPNAKPRALPYVVLMQANTRSIQSLAEYRVNILLLERGSPPYKVADVPLNPDTGDILGDPDTGVDEPPKPTTKTMSWRSSLYQTSATQREAFPSILTVTSAFCAFILINRSVHPF